MNGPLKRRARVLKQTAGWLLLVAALHYALDKPTRPLVVQSAFVQLHRVTRLLTRSQKMDEPLVVYGPLPVSPRAFFDNVSFEAWEEEPYPLLRAWSSSLTVSTGNVVKKNTDVVRSGRAAVRLECDGSSHCGNVRQAFPEETLPWFWRRRLRFSVWARSTIPGAVCVRIDDGIDRSSACLQNATGEMWEPVTVERVISTGATRIVLIIDRPRETDNPTPVYVDDASLVIGQLPAVLPRTTAVPVPLAPLSEQN